MIIRVIDLTPGAAHDATRPAITRPRCDYRVLPVVALWVTRQQPLSVLKGDAVALKWERAALLDQRDRLSGLVWEIGKGDGGQSALGRCRSALCGGRGTGWGRGLRRGG